MREIIKILKEEHNLINLFWFNFHKVDKDVYRSAQLMPWRLKKLIKKYNIKVVVNLRGKQNYLYKKEEEICRSLGVEYYVIPLSSRKKPKEESLIKLRDLFLDKSKRPLLFHCKAGADRTGFAAVMYHLLNNKNSEFAIKKELKLKYGYIPFSKAGFVKELFKDYNKGDIVEFIKNKNIDYKGNKFINFIYEKILRRE